MKGTITAILLTLAAYGHASYEMLLVADAGGTGFASRVHRFDPVTQTYLGSFGQGILDGARGVEVDSNGIAWVGENDGSRIRLFNASTGIYLGTVVHNVGADAYGRILQGKYFRNSAGTLYSINTTTYVPISLSTGGTAHFVAPWSSTELFCSRGNSVLLRINAVTGAIITSQTLPVMSTSAYCDAVIVDSWLGNAGRSLYFARPFDGTNDLTYVSLSSTGVIGSSNSINLASLNGVFGLAKAHSGFFAAGTLASDASKGGVTYIDEFGAEKYTFGSAYIRSPRGMATVLAPEPGTLAAIGVGLAALARRRRRR